MPLRKSTARKSVASGSKHAEDDQEYPDGSNTEESGECRSEDSVETSENETFLNGF